MMCVQEGGAMFPLLMCVYIYTSLSQSGHDKREFKNWLSPTLHTRAQLIGEGILPSV